MGPFVVSKEKTSKMMIHLVIALFPLLLFSIYKNGYLPYHHGYIGFLEMFRPLYMVVVGGFVSFSIESIYLFIRKRSDQILKSYSFFPGLFIAFLLPVGTPFYLIILASVVASISKIVLGGFGKNWLNPALVGYLLLILVFGSQLGSYLNAYELDTLSSSTPLTNATMMGGVAGYSQLVSPYGSLWDFLFGMVPGGMGEVSALLCILAFVYLTATKTIKWRIPVSYVGTVFLLTFIIARISGVGIYYPLFHILSGGLLFGAVFMATDPVTSPVTPFGQVLQGIFLGILTVILRFVFTEGVAISILFMNLFVILLDRIGARSRLNPTHWIVWLSICTVLIMGTGIALAAIYKTDPNTDPNFSILTKNKVNNGIEYTVTQKGYGGDIKAKVVVENKRIMTIEILASKETKNRYQLVMDANYLDSIIASQDNLESLDTISTATVTSSALKSLAKNVLSDVQ